MKRYWELFVSFFRVGLLTFGGGYAMLPILRREVVEKRAWATDEELADYYAIGQCTPGVISVNTATFIGYKQKGVLGGVCATLSVVMPSFFIIILIAALLQNFSEYPAVKNAFAGIRACVCVLIFNAVVKLLKSSVVDGITLGIFLAVILAFLFLDLSPVVSVLICGAAGILLQMRKGASK